MNKIVVMLAGGRGGRKLRYSDIWGRKFRFYSKVAFSRISNFENPFTGDKVIVN